MSRLRTALGLALAMVIAVPSVAIAAPGHWAHSTRTRQSVKPKRYVHTVIDYAYSYPCFIDNWDEPTINLTGPAVGYCPTSLTFSTVGTDKYMSVTIRDATGRRVPFAWETSGVNTSSTAINRVYCGSTQNIKIWPGGWSVLPTVAVGDVACPIPPSYGTLVVQVSNYPFP